MPKGKAPVSGATYWVDPPKLTEADKAEILQELYAARLDTTDEPTEEQREGTWAAIAQLAGSYRGHHKQSAKTPPPTQTELNEEFRKIRCAANKLSNALCELDESGQKVFREWMGRDLSEMPATDYPSLDRSVSDMAEWMWLKQGRRPYGRAVEYLQVQKIKGAALRLNSLLISSSLSARDRVAKTFSRISGYLPGVPPYDIRAQLLLVADLGNIYIRFPKSYTDNALFRFLLDLALVWGRTTGDPPRWQKSLLCDGCSRESCEEGCEYYSDDDDITRWESPFFDWAEKVVTKSVAGEWSTVVPKDLARDAMKCARWTLDP